MSIFGKKSDAVKKAEEQYQIQKLKNKAEAERLKLLEKEAKIKIREKSGGFGGTIVLHDRDKLPETNKQVCSGKRSRK